MRGDFPWFRLDRMVEVSQTEKVGLYYKPLTRSNHAKKAGLSRPNSNSTVSPRTVGHIWKMPGGLQQADGLSDAGGWVLALERVLWPSAKSPRPDPEVDQPARINRAPRGRPPCFPVVERCFGVRPGVGGIDDFQPTGVGRGKPPGPRSV